MVFISKNSLRMSDKKIITDIIETAVQKESPLITTINGSHVTDCDRKASNEETANHINFFAKPPSPVPEPALSCQALKHAVSALTRIDDFLLEEIGCGFFATVYKATHRVTGEVMVMKINKDYTNRSCALREVQLMNKLSHPNILRFLGVCVHEGQLHALTEYISGGTLEALLADKAQELPWMLRMKLALDIAKGMNYLHSEGVIHRDLTSKNVLIKKGENRNHQAVIADFGLATKIPDPTSTVPLPTVGCPWWMAPEVINGKFYDQRADLFSFGIIMLEITGRIEADPDTMPRTKNFGVDYVKVGDLVEYCPLDFVRLAFLCCRVLPEMRPSSDVITVTLEQMYKSLNADTLNGSEKLRKRSKSENNILQSSDSFTEMQEEETPLTPQTVAQAMIEDDPHYSPTDENPFARLTIFKDGKKVHEFPHHRKCSGNSTVLDLSQRCLNRLSPSHNSDCSTEKPESQSLPSSPIMLKRAAEKMHQTSLHGSDVVQLDIQHDSLISFSGVFKSDFNAAKVEHQRTQFKSNRTRSLGSVDFFSPRHGPGYVYRSKGGPCQLYPSNSDNVDKGSLFEPEIKDSLGRLQSVSRLSSCKDYPDSEEWLHLRCNSNLNCSVESSLNYSPKGGVCQVVPSGSCGENLSTSSYISNCNIIEEEEAIDVFSGSPFPFCGESQRRHPMTVGSLICHDFFQPQIALECDSYVSSHLNTDVNECIKNKGISRLT